MIFMDDKPAVIQPLVCMEIAGYADVVRVPRTPEGHGIVQKNFLHLVEAVEKCPLIFL